MDLGLCSEERHQQVRGGLIAVQDEDEDNQATHDLLIWKNFGIADGKSGIEKLVICAQQVYLCWLNHRFCMLAIIQSGTLKLWLFDLCNQKPINLHTSKPHWTNLEAVRQIKKVK